MNMDSIKDILSLMDNNHYVLKYGENEVEISQDDLLQEFENGVSFIDYLADFHYVQNIYDTVSWTGFNQEWTVNQELVVGHREYYSSLLFIKYFIKNLKDSLRVLRNAENIDDTFKKIVKEEEKLLEQFYGGNKTNDFLEEEIWHKLFIKNGDKTRESLTKIIWLGILIERIVGPFPFVYTGLVDDFLNHFKEKLSYILKLFTKVVTRGDGMLMRENFHDPLARWFAEKINNMNFSNLLEFLSAKNKKKLKCYAVLIFQETKYYSINGIDDNDAFNRIHEVFKQLLGSEYEGVKIFDGVRYYLNDKTEFIMYKQFKEEEINKKENRMFTCCERKLFAKMRKQKKIETAKLIVTSPPCEYCSREIQYIQKNYNKIISLIYPQPEHIYRHDKIAIEIWDRNN